MAIRKPIFVVPLDLGSMVCGNATTGNAVFNLNEPLWAGLTWRTDGISNAWTRGELASGQWINFCAMLAANAQPGTKYRLRLGGTQAEVDGTPATPAIDTDGIATGATYTASSDHVSYVGGTALNSNGLGLRDGSLTASTATAWATTAAAGQFITADLGAVYAVESVVLADNPGFGSVAFAGAIIEGSPDGSTWTTIDTVAATPPGSTLITYPVNASYRYIRLRQPGASGLAVSEFQIKLFSGYDSGELAFVAPAISREDGLYHSHLEIPSLARAKWWRIDISGHTGDFEASSLVLGKQIVPSRYYNQDYERGVEDLGEMNWGRWAVPDEIPGAILRTLGLTLAWQTEAEFEANFRPMMEKLGKRGAVYCCFDPEATTYRQAKTYLGVMRKPPFARGVPKPLTVSQEFEILSPY